KGAGALGKELPAGFFLLAIFRSGFELGASPENGSLGRRVKAVGGKHRPLVLVAQKNELTLPDQGDGFTGVGTIADDVPQAIDFRDFVLLDILKDGLQAFQVAVDIAYQRFHVDPSPLGARGSDRKRAKPLRPQSQSRQGERQTYYGVYFA